MRKSIWLLWVAPLMFAGALVYGQQKELNNAYTNYGNGFLDRAKTAIDKAIENDITKTEAKTWMYRGNIYLLLADANNNPESHYKEYKGLCTDCADIAYEAYLKAIELDKSIEVSMQIATPKAGLKFCAGLLANEAAKLYEVQKYEEASLEAEKGYKADPANEYVLYIAGLAAEMAKHTDLAKTHYTELIRKKSKIVTPYLRLANMYQLENDTAHTLSILETGKPMFFFDDSVNIDYAVALAIALSWADKADEATEVMDKALKKYPTNYILLLNYGSALNSDRKYDEAESYLKRAVELNPDDVRANFNLGNCYYNNYVEQRKSLDDITDNELYNQKATAMKSLLEQARPYLEQAHKIDPKDIDTLRMLRTIYAELGEQDNLNTITQKINDLKK